MTDDEGGAPKKGVDLAKLADGGSAARQLREKMASMASFAADGRALQNALGQNSAVEIAMRGNTDALFKVLPSTSAFGEITMPRLASLIDPVKINGLTEIRERLLPSVGFDAVGDLFAKGSGITNVTSNLDLMLQDVRASQVAIQSAVSAYLDQHRMQAERISAMIGALAIPRINPATFGIGSAIALSETNAFKVAGLMPDYTEQFRSITGALGEQLSGFADLKLARKAFVLQPDLVSGLSILLERALAQQQVLLEQQCQPVTETQPRQQTLIAERLTIIASIVAIVYTMLCVYMMVEEQLGGGNAATLANTAAIEESAQTLEQMRDSFGALADQLERMGAIQEEAAQDAKATNADVADILRGIANTLNEPEYRRESATEHPD